MITTNLSSLQIHKLSYSQYETAKNAGTLDENVVYLTPIPGKTSELVNDAGYTTLMEVDTEIESKKDVEGGLVSYELFMSQSSGGDFLTDEEFLAEVTS